jgi:hypothetical protein
MEKNEQHTRVYNKREALTLKTYYSNTDKHMLKIKFVIVKGFYLRYLSFLNHSIILLNVSIFVTKYL